jgi:leucyl aminopeptidase
LIGVGELAKLDTASLRKAAAAFARAAANFASVSTTLANIGRLDRKIAAQVVVEGMSLATHRYTDLKTVDKKAPKLAHVSLVGSGAATTSGAKRGQVIANATNMARDFANMPPAYLTATIFANKAVEIAGESGLKVEVFNKDQLLAMGCGGIVGVNRGSVEPPRMVRLTYKPTGAKGKPHLVLVGKGVMYDSGGISLKPSDPSHAMMKGDMSGAAAVLATMSTLKALGCTNQVTGYLMCTDNLPSGSAMAMGEVLTMRNGKTVEIHNTDAEGRLVLADGLSLATEQKPDAIVDIATLTGACQRALGSGMAGVMGNNQKWIDQLTAAAERTSDKLWQLPLEREYRPALDSYVADMKNVGGEAGAITAALFLEEFVGDTTWAHIDIAGPMWTDSDNGWLQKGMTGYGTRLLIDAALNFRRPTRAK